MFNLLVAFKGIYGNINNLNSGIVPKIRFKIIILFYSYKKALFEKLPKRYFVLNFSSCSMSPDDTKSETGWKNTTN